MNRCEHYTDTIFYQIEQTAKYCRNIGLHIFQKLDMPITLDEFAALDVMSLNENICQRELAKLILKDRANTGRILNSLEEKGLIKRQADTKNNRLVRRLKLSDKGMKVTDKCANLLRKYINALPDLFADCDKKELKDLIIKFRKSIETEVEMNI